MFSSLKPSFGTIANNTSFGFSNTSNVTPNPFGQPAFGKPSGTGFSNTTSAFGSTPAPLFGSTTQHGTSLFGAGAQTTSFGQPAVTQPAFGSTMFGTASPQPAGTSLFGSPNTSSFGQQNKPTGFGFGSSAGNSGFFGQQANPVQTQQPNTGLFGQNTNNLFGSNQGFGSPTPGPPSGTVVKFTLVTGTDTMVKGSINQTISTRHHCITCMKEYEGKSLEELRWEDYQANRKGPQQGQQPSSGLFGGITQPVGGGLFGSGSIATSSTPLFGQTENKSVFGSSAPTGGFGQPNTAFGGTTATSSSGLFGKPLGGFGTNTSTTSAFAFNPAAQTPLFGSPAVSKPFGATNQPSNLFGQQPTGFGAQNSFGSFGTTTNQNAPLFSQKSTMPFNMGTTTGTGFGAFNPTATPTSGSLFTGVKPNPTFGGFGVANSTAPMFGQSSFGQPNQSLFSSTFNKPTTNFFGQTNQNPVPGANLSIGTGANLFGNNMAKPTNLFGTNTGMYNTGFGNNALNNSFIMAGNAGSQTGGAMVNPNQCNNEQQIISMSLSPFGLSSHLSGISDTKHNLQDLSRPTNPNELKQLLNTVSKPLVTSPVDKLQPKQIFGRKVPIFDGLEQRDEVIVNFRINSPNPKRLVLRNNRDRYKIHNDDSDVIINRHDRSGGNTTFDSDFEVINLTGADLTHDKSMRLPLHLAPAYKSPNMSPTKELQLNKSNTVSSPSENRHSSNNITNDTSDSILGTDDNEQFLEASDQPDDTSYEVIRKDADETNRSFAVMDESVQTNNTDIYSSLINLREPHPTGIVLTRPEYYTKPTLDELVKYIAEDGSCIVKGFTIGRLGYGNVRFSEAFDVSNLNLDELVHFRDKEINIYPDESKKPALGQGLNRKAQVTLDKVWPYNKKKKTVVKDIDTLVKMDYADRLRRLCERQNTRFVEYRPDTGSWVFKVDHFSKYGHRDSDDSDIEEITDPNQKKDKSDLNLKVPDKVLNAESAEGLTKTKTPFTMNTNQFGLTSSDNLDLYSQESRESMSSTTMPKYSLMKSTFFQEKEREVVFFDMEPDSDNSCLPMDNCLYDDYSSLLKKHVAVETEPMYLAMDAEDLEELDMGFPNYIPDIDVRSAAVLDNEDVNLSVFADIYSEIENLPYAESTFYEDSLYDNIAYRGRSFKVGWGKGFTLITVPLKGIFDEELNNLNSSLSDQNDNSFSPVINIVKIRCGNIRDEQNLNEQLLCQLNNSTPTLTNDMPYFKSETGYGLLESNKKLMKELLKKFENRFLKYDSEIWSLCGALWGNIDDHDLYDYDKTTIKRKLLGEWLKDVVHDSVNDCLNIRRRASLDDDISRIVTYVSGNRLEEAANFALESRNAHLSLFLSQLPCPAHIRMFLVQQLSLWQETSKETLINTNVMKLYMLLAGIPAMNFHDQYLNICDTMDWIRSFAVYFWFICPASEPISSVVDTYDEAFLTYLCASKPTPFYNSELEGVYDLTYHLLKHYCDNKYPIELVLDPINHTPDSLDYSLSWFLLQTFSSLGLNTNSTELHEHICLNFAARLESMDMWHWAIFVLLFIEDPHIKKYSITNIINRHVELLSTSSKSYKQREEIIVNHFHISSQCIDSAKADLALVMENHREAVYYLSYSNRWNEMHDVLFKQVVPEHYICYDYNYLQEMLGTLKKFEKSLKNWYGTGEFILNLTDLSVLYNDAISAFSPKDKIKYLQKFRSLMLNLSLQFENFPDFTYLHNICLAEMSSRILDMIRILFNLPKFKEVQTMSLTENCGRITCASRDSLIKELIATIDKFIHNFTMDNNLS